MAKGDDIEDRLINFSVSIVQLCDNLPDTHAGRHIAGQLLRCGTSPAPNYGEARGAESKKDFVHKLGITLKELNESYIWVEVAKRSKLIPLNDVISLEDECKQLSRIINSGIITARGRKE